MKRKPSPKSGAGRRQRPAPSHAEDERKRIAQLLHNGVAQTLCGAQFLARLLIKKAERANTAATEEKDLAHAIDLAITEVQNLMKQLDS